MSKYYEVLSNYSELSEKELNEYCNDLYSLKYAIDDCNLELFKYLFNNSKDFIFDELCDLTTKCAFVNNGKALDILKFLLNLDDDLYYENDVLFFKSYELDNISIVKYLYETYEKDNINLELEYCLLNSCTNASIDCVKFFHEIDPEYILNNKIYVNENEELIYSMFCKTCSFLKNDPDKSLKLMKYLYDLRPDLTILSDNFSDEIVISIHKHCINSLKWLFSKCNKKSLFVSTNQYSETKIVNLFLISLVECDDNITNFIYDQFKDEIDTNISNNFSNFFKELYENKTEFWYVDFDEVMNSINNSIIKLFDLQILDIEKNLKDIFEFFLLNHNIKLSKYLFEKYKDKILSLSIDFNKLINDLLSHNLYLNIKYKCKLINIFIFLYEIKQNFVIDSKCFEKICINNYDSNVIDFILEKQRDIYNLINLNEIFCKIFEKNINFDYITYFFEKFNEIDLSYNNEYNFRIACEKSDDFLIEWLLEKKPDINISADNEYAFKIACRNNDITLAKLLLEKKPDIDISVDNEYAFKKACDNENIQLAKWLLEMNPNIDISTENEYAFCKICEIGDLIFANWLLKLKPDINLSINNEYPFYLACINGHHHIAKWLLEKKPDIDISVNNEYIFIDSCKNNEYLIVKSLLKIKPNIDISINNHEVFVYMCENNYINLATLFCSLNNNYEIELNDELFIEDEFVHNFEVFTVNNNYYDLIQNELDQNNMYVVSWSIKKIFKILGIKNIDSPEDCCICLETSNIITQCNHYLCLKCLNNLKNISCPLCRTILSGYYSIE